jgi:DNA polymerase
MTRNRSANTAREVLAFYREAGVADIVGEEPVNRLAEGAAAATPESGTAGAKPDREPLAADRGPIAGPGPGSAPRSVPTEGDRARRSPSAATATYQAATDGDDRDRPRERGLLPPAAPEAAVMAARQVARSAKTLEDLRAILERFDGCALKATATQLVFADGNPQARVMFVGEAPGRDEDIEGRPFVGRSGKLLDRMMAAIGLDRTRAYIANIVPWRPPGNRTPTPQEVAICLPFVKRQIELADPDILVCLGGPSAQALLGVKDGIKKTRGRWFSYHTGTREIRAIATFHPAYLLRSPLDKRLAWRDFLAIRKALEG